MPGLLRPRGRRFAPTGPLLLATLTAACSLLLGVGFAQRAPIRELRGPFPVVEVLDGDTVRVESNLSRRTIRLIGIDTPEVAHPERGREPFGEEASAYTKRLLPEGTEVWVEVDHEREDAYGRLLAYLYLPGAAGEWRAGDTSYLQVNQEIARAGFANVLTIPPNVQYADLFAGAVEEARAEERGIWAPAAPGAGAAEGDGARPAGAARADVAGEVVIACALYDPAGNDEGSEWVSLEVRAPTDTRGMYLYDEGSGSRFPLPPGLQEPGELRVPNDGRGVWNNGGDVIHLMRGDERLDAWDYSDYGGEQGEVVCRR